MDTRINLSIPEGFSEAIDEWRRHQPDIPGRSEAIRRLVERGLEHETLLNLTAELWEILQAAKAAGFDLPDEQNDRLLNAQAAFAYIFERVAFPDAEERLIPDITDEDKADYDRAGFIFHEGKRAGMEGRPLSDNPYGNEVGRRLWEAGHLTGTGPKSS